MKSNKQNKSRSRRTHRSKKSKQIMKGGASAANSVNQTNEKITPDEHIVEMFKTYINRIYMQYRNIQHEEIKQELTAIREIINNPNFALTPELLNAAIAKCNTHITIILDTIKKLASKGPKYISKELQQEMDLHFNNLLNYINTNKKFIFYI